MCFVYVVQHGAVLGIDGGVLTVRYLDGSEEKIPKNTVEGISVFAKAQLTTQCIEFCLMNNVKVGFFSESGFYKGSLCSVSYANTDRLRKQIALSDDSFFSLSISKKIIRAKIINQAALIRRYSYEVSHKECCHYLNRIAKHKIPGAGSINQIIGYEGIASRKYFDWLSMNIEEGFEFDKRNRRPAMDPFNCMLNFGYSLLSKEIYGELENRYLNPYIGFMHQDKYGHPSLASDLIEEWRPVIVDSAVLSLIQGHEISRDCFVIDKNGCRMSDEAIRKVLYKLEMKMETKTQYLKYINKPVSFREAIWHQADRLSKAIESADPDKYVPIIIR